MADKVLTIGISHPEDKLVSSILNQKLFIQNRESNASTQSIQLLQKHQVDFAIVQADIAYKATRVDDNTSPKLRAVLTLYPEMLAYITHKKETPINFESSIKNAKSIAFCDTDTHSTAHTIFTAFDIDCEHKIKNIAEAKVAFQSHEIDGFITLRGHPNHQLSQFITEQNLTLVPLYGKKFDQLASDRGYFIKGGIPEKVYGVKEDVESIGVKALLLTTQEMDEESVYNITKLILENIETFKVSDPRYRSMSVKEMLEGLSIPQHKGAIKAFNAF